jgi:hypothetical protein
MKKEKGERTVRDVIALRDVIAYGLLLPVMACHYLSLPTTAYYYPPLNTHKSPPPTRALKNFEFSRIWASLFC